MKFTDKWIKSLKSRSDTYRVWSNELAGYGIRVSPKGKKTFIYRYKFQGQSRLITIGVYPKITLAKANTIYADYASKVENGDDPWADQRIEKRRRVLSPTVKEFVDTYINQYCIGTNPEKPRKKTWKADEKLLHREVVPAIGHLKIQDVSKPDIRNIINKVYERGAGIMANRLLSCMNKMFSFAVDEDVVELNICSGIKKKTKECARERILSHNEIKQLWKALEKYESQDKKKSSVTGIMKVLLISGQRSGEVRRMEWAELHGNMWHIPGDKTKNKLAHIVPLPPLAMKIIEEQRRITGGSRYVFQGRRVGKEGKFGETCPDETAVSHAFQRIIKDFGWPRTTPHDLRRTLRSELSRLQVGPIIAEKVLNHKMPGVLGVYDRHDYISEKTIALQRWNDCLRGVIFPDEKKSKVVKMPDRAVM